MHLLPSSSSYEKVRRVGIDARAGDDDDKAFVTFDNFSRVYAPSDSDLIELRLRRWLKNMVSIEVSLACTSGRSQRGVLIKRF